MDRNLFKIAYLAVDDDLAYGANAIVEQFKEPSARLSLENRLANQCGFPAGAIVVVFLGFRSNAQQSFDSLLKLQGMK